MTSSETQIELVVVWELRRFGRNVREVLWFWVRQMIELAYYPVNAVRLGVIVWLVYEWDLQSTARVKLANEFPEGLRQIDHR